MKELLDEIKKLDEKRYDNLEEENKILRNISLCCENLLKDELLDRDDKENIEFIKIYADKALPSEKITIFGKKKVIEPEHKDSYIDAIKNYANILSEQKEHLIGHFKEQATVFERTMTGSNVR